MKVMSFNILCGGSENRSWENRIKLVVETIRKRRPDTFGLQEAHKGWIDALTERFPEYDFIGVGRDDGEQEGEYNPIFYLKDMYDVIDSGTFWLSETPEKPSKGWDSACTRICTHVVLKNKETDEIFSHFNTHLDHRGPIAQVEGAKLLLSKIKEIYSDIPVVLTGDFNIFEDSDTYKILTSDVLIDCRYQATETDTIGTFHLFDSIDIAEMSPIDYIFVDDSEWDVKKFEVIKDRYDNEAPSDHNPVYVKLHVIDK